MTDRNGSLFQKTGPIIKKKHDHHDLNLPSLCQGISILLGPRRLDWRLTQEKMSGTGFTCNQSGPASWPADRRTVVNPVSATCQTMVSVVLRTMVNVVSVTLAVCSLGPDFAELVLLICWRHTQSTALSRCRFPLSGFQLILDLTLATLTIETVWWHYVNQRGTLLLSVI